MEGWKQQYELGISNNEQQITLKYSGKYISLSTYSDIIEVYDLYK